MWLHSHGGREASAITYAVRPAQWVRAGVRDDSVPAPAPRRFRDVVSDARRHRATPGRSREWRPVARSQLPRTLWATRLSRAAVVGVLHTPPGSSTLGFRCRSYLCKNLIRDRERIANSTPIELKRQEQILLPPLRLTHNELFN
ncbi:unnamed protein product [Arctia plantaginis]|uniref:Uncharacterized protein n=1 Tax=Arctia plantaginis TaxID=874455 RepID=A0A8S0Z0F1_ARCPL|nr:unnamed protein product [Arctia plantaginis]